VFECGCDGSGCGSRRTECGGGGYWLAEASDALLI
jgi:hypothetical protein